MKLYKIITFLFIYLNFFYCSGQEKKNEIIIDPFKSWSYDCSSNYYVYIELQIGAQFRFSTNFAINTEIKKVRVNTYDILFSYPVIRPIPDRMLDCKNYSEKKPIARIKFIDKYKLEFEWFGFYNLKTKKRVHLKNPFTNKVEKGFVILNQCEK